MILADHLAPGLRVVFCGTAPGRVSARAGHYYANPGNRFWAILAETGLTPRRLAPAEDHLMPDLGLGLTDLAKTAFGQDAEIPAEAWDRQGLMVRVRRARPARLAFTSLTAARLALDRGGLRAGRLEHDPALPGIALWALPSTSGLARRHFSALPWQEFARDVTGVAGR